MSPCPVGMISRVIEPLYLWPNGKHASDHSFWGQFLKAARKINPLNPKLLSCVPKICLNLGPGQKHSTSRWNIQSGLECQPYLVPGESREVRHPYPGTGPSAGTQPRVLAAVIFKSSQTRLVVYSVCCPDFVADFCHLTGWAAGKVLRNPRKAEAQACPSRQHPAHPLQPSKPPCLQTSGEEKVLPAEK